MPKITFIDVDGNSRECEVPNGISVMEGAIQRKWWTSAKFFVSK